MKQTINLGGGRSVVLLAPPVAGYDFLKGPLVEVHVFGLSVASFPPTFETLSELIHGLEQLRATVSS